MTAGISTAAAAETTTQSLILRLIAYIKTTPPFSNLSPGQQLQLLSALLQQIRPRRPAVAAFARTLISSSVRRPVMCGLVV